MYNTLLDPGNLADHNVKSSTAILQAADVTNAEPVTSGGDQNAIRLARGPGTRL